MTATRPQRRCNQPHGTIARYAAGCSCLPCCDAQRSWERDYRAERKDGAERRVDATAARDRIRVLTNHGWRTRAIAEQAALSYNTVRYIRTGRRARIAKETEEAIFTLTLVPLATLSTALVPAWPTLRRIERLRERFSLEDIARAVGISHKGLPQPGQRSVQARTARRVQEAAEMLRSGAVGL